MSGMIEFLDSPAGLALKGLVIVAFLDFATGAFASLRDGTFALDALAAFVRKHIFGRVAPIGLMLVVGYFGGETGTLFLAGAVAAASAYVLETAASVWGNLKPPSPTVVAEAKPAAIVNPVPTE